MTSAPLRSTPFLPVLAMFCGLSVAGLARAEGDIPEDDALRWAREHPSRHRYQVEDSARQLGGYVGVGLVLDTAAGPARPSAGDDTATSLGVGGSFVGGVRTGHVGVGARVGYAHVVAVREEPAANGPSIGVLSFELELDARLRGSEDGRLGVHLAPAFGAAALFAGYVTVPTDSPRSSPVRVVPYASLRLGVAWRVVRIDVVGSVALPQSFDGRRALVAALPVVGLSTSVVFERGGVRR